MDIKNMKEALKLQKDLMANITQHMESLGNGHMPSLEELLKEKEQVILRNMTALKTAKQERDAVVSRWQEQIDRRNASLESLKQEIAEIKKRIKK
jgi:chromosome segregation ATPase